MAVIRLRSAGRAQRHKGRRVGRRLGALLATLAMGLLVAFVAAPAPRAASDPVVAAAGDISCDPASIAYNGGNGTATACTARATSALLNGVDAVLPLGDEQYACGGLSAFQNAYDQTWGHEKGISYPVPGNHEYQSSGGTDCSTNAAGYFGYFGTRAGDPGTGYYSYTVGAWHVIALNSELCFTGTGCGFGSAEETWLQGDLAAHPTGCKLVYWHEPRFYSYGTGSNTALGPFWQDLYKAHVDVVLNGHEHFYERFALQNPAEQPDPNGIREFIVGTGGAGLMSLGTRQPTSEVADDTTHGVLELTLHSGSYDWNFVPQSGETFTDSGATDCHSPAPPADTTAPTTSVACNGAPCTAGWYNTNPVNVTLAASDDGGSGVARTVYTTDGSDPASSATALTYTGPFTVGSSATVKFFSTDNAGNAEPTGSQTIQVDTVTPRTTVGCNDTACAGAYIGSVSVGLLASDSGGSGLAETLYTTDGTDPATSPTAITYTGPFLLAATTTVEFCSVDNAGNVEPTQTQWVGIGAITAGNVNATPSDDTYTSQSSPDTTYGSRTVLNVDGGHGLQQTFLKFAVSGVPAGASGVTATLKLLPQFSVASSVIFTVSEVTTSWDESTLTWRTQPPLQGTVTTGAGATNGSYKNFDVSSLVTGNGTYAVAITGTNLKARSFTSKEAATNPPVLTVSWTG